LVADQAAGELIRFGLMVTIAQLGDFLYAPTDFILISRLINTETIAVYAPAVQIDAGLLVIVAAIASVLLPRAATAHASGNVQQLKQYYLRGTLVSAGLLLLSGLAVWTLSPWIFQLWLGNDLPLTRAILPLVLIHTIVGGSSAVGRSILLGMGKVKPFTISVLITGASNLILSYVFVRFFHLGLRGIVLGTIIAVVARCAVWMPWYVMRTLRAEAVTSSTPDRSPTSG
jgi:O-antigen/teichoic acid export membrane protein